MAAVARCAAPQPQRYQRRRPEQTLWYRTVQAHFATWLELSGGPGGESPPAYVERTFRRYLDCGIRAHGFARAGPCGSGCWRCPSGCATSFSTTSMAVVLR